MTWRQRTENELDEGIDRIGHAYESLLYATKWTIEHQCYGHPGQERACNPYIESALIHARKLTQFLDPRGHVRQNDVKVADFLGTDRSFKVEIEDGQYRHISQRLAHMTYAPIFGGLDHPRWPLEEMTDAIAQAMQRFISALASVDPQRTQRLHNAHEAFWPRYRKAVGARIPRHVDD